MSMEPQHVKDFIYAAHGDLESVQKLLETYPELLHAAWHWGKGDWETALGAAAHMGRKDIAAYLLEKGARLDLFAAAMLGKLDIVQAMIADDPRLAQAKGPHTIPLLAHAQAGGEEAAAVVAYLTSLQA